MIKKCLFLIFLVFSFLLLTYIIPKSPDFPKPPPDFIQSFEPADVETTFRRGYYTNLSREEVINYYKQEFNHGFNIYTPRLNYPPEEAESLIRDQTKSTFLEEIVHPLRESLYINGFQPKTEEYAQYYKGVRYNQKITIRYVVSPVLTRLYILFTSMTLGYLLILEYLNAKKPN